jgi:hypothetical protein
MANRHFQFRLRSHPNAAAASIDNLSVEMLVEGGAWQRQQPQLDSPPFRLYLIALLLCEHRQLVVHSQERGLPLHQVSADYSVSTSADWDLLRISSRFRIQLEAAATTLEPLDRAWLVERMRLCPVGRNLPATVERELTLAMES